MKKVLAVCVVVVGILSGCGGINDSVVNNAEDNQTLTSEDDSTTAEFPNSEESDVEVVTAETSDAKNDNMFEYGWDYDDVSLSFVDLPHYITWNSLMDKADIAVEGVVTQSYTFKWKIVQEQEQEIIPCVITKVQVTKVHLGNVKAGDIVTFMEGGGVLTYGETRYFNNKHPDMTEEERSTKILFTLGVDFMMEGETWLIFGCNSSEWQSVDLGEPYNYLFGEFQSRFKYNPEDNSYSRPIPENIQRWLGDLKINADDLETTLEKAKYEESLSLYILYRCLQCLMI